MADCDFCGVSRPTLCPVKVLAPAYLSAYPTGTWRGLCQECLENSDKAYHEKQPASGKKCELCGKNDSLYSVTVQVPIFEEPYRRTAYRKVCEECLKACNEAHQKRISAAHSEGHGH